MDAGVRLISSMATKGIVAKAVPAYMKATGKVVHLESIGGVDAARRIRAGDPFDVVLLSLAALQSLSEEGHIEANTIRPFANSLAAVAVLTGAPRPGLDETSIRDAIVRSSTIGISTGPSGTGMISVLQRWGIYHEMKARIVQAPPAVPVAHLISGGKAEIGFQQLSELLGHDSIDIVGTLPESVLPATIFAIGIRRGSPDLAAARELVQYLESDETADVRRQHGMQPV